ncbi:conserved hypothetical protein [Sinorhizobium medicae]|uniref:Uncharacterized protein n=1 Tax=Sinorhizobium medicae TaxID=110321 RepID=A0A508WXZ3_9HYPH|nr:conserved hypothetical protein [Sinorhizobium medicae]
MPKSKNPAVTPEMAREAVLEAARMGLRGRAARPGRNPLYRAPTEAGAAWTHVYGTCRALSEWGGEGENLALARRGVAERADDQSANIAAVRKCVAMLGRFLEALDT